MSNISLYQLDIFAKYQYQLDILPTDINCPNIITILLGTSIILPNIKKKFRDIVRDIIIWYKYQVDFG